MACAPFGKLNLESPPPGGSRTTDSFEKLELIGKGTYGQVFKAKDITTGEFVALKKIRNTELGFPLSAIREIRILRSLQHDNVIKLKEVVTSPGRKNDEQGGSDTNKYRRAGVYMVLEYMEHDLFGLINRPGVIFSVPQIKCYMKQLLTGLNYCHTNQILHRDIKGCNLLINNEGTLKLADFGLARSLPDVDTKLSINVISLWYRPPEIFLGATKYGPEVDIWSAGCLFAEFFAGKTIIRGKTETDQLNKIFELCGSPNENNWPGVSELPLFSHFIQPIQPLVRRLRQEFHYVDPHALDLLDRMLTLDPSRRISARDALNAEYFWTDPMPCDSKSLPKYESSRALDYEKRRQEQAAEKRRQERRYHPMANHQLPFPSISSLVNFHNMLNNPGASRSSQSHVSPVPTLVPRPESQGTPGFEYLPGPSGSNQQYGSDQTGDNSNK